MPPGSSGRSLREPFAALYDWTVDHADEIRERQRVYDTRTESTERSPGDGPR